MAGTLLVGTLEQEERTEDANRKNKNDDRKNIEFGTTEEQLATAAEEQLISEGLLEMLLGDTDTSNLLRRKPSEDDSRDEAHQDPETETTQGVANIQPNAEVEQYSHTTMPTMREITRAASEAIKWISRTGFEELHPIPKETPHCTETVTGSMFTMPTSLQSNQKNPSPEKHANWRNQQALPGPSNYAK